MDKKRYTIRFPKKLSEYLDKVSKNRGISVNSLVTELCWRFVEDFEKSYKAIERK